MGQKIERIEIVAPAKVNLFLYVLGQRGDGYHEIFSLMQAIDLSDTLIITPASKFSLQILGNSSVKPDETNTVFKAWECLSKYIGKPIDVKVQVYKKIPVGAGLGGGSSDAASFLVAINKLMKLNLSRAELLNLGVQVGSDVPFFCGSGTSIVEGRGEIVNDIELPLNYKMLLVVPPFRKESTRSMYLSIKNTLTPPGIFYKMLNSNFWQLLVDFSNSFTEILCKMEPKYEGWLYKMKKIGAELALPTGSGTAYFGVFRDEGRVVTSAMEDFDGEVFLVSPVRIKRC